MEYRVALRYQEDYIPHNFMDMVSSLFAEAGLSLERLRAFCQVAEAGGFTKAAGGDPAKQPLLSRQIKELETFFGVELLKRQGRGVVLTKVGEELHRIVRDSFGALADFKVGIQHQPLILHIGAGDSIIQWMILPALTAVRKALPNIRLKLLNLPTQSIVGKLESGEIELGIVRKDAISDALDGATLGSMQFGLFVPKRAVTNKERSDWKAILGRCPLATLEGGGNYRSALESAASEAGIALQIEVECSSFPSVAKAMTAASLGGLLPVAAGEELPSGQFIHVKVPWVSHLERTVSLAWNPRVVSVRERVGDAARRLLAIWKK